MKAGSKLRALITKASEQAKARRQRRPTNVKISVRGPLGRARIKAKVRKPVAALDARVTIGAIGEPKKKDGLQTLKKNGNDKGKRTRTKKPNKTEDRRNENMPWRPFNRLKQFMARHPFRVERDHGLVGENVHKRRVIERDNLTIDRRTTITDLPAEVKRVKVQRTENEIIPTRRRATKAELDAMRGR